MSEQTPNSWQSIHDDVLARIRSGIWKPGDAIPNESELAVEFGCARATVNRALRELAEAGLLERRRKAGTRVAAFPTRRAKLHIPLIREEISNRGAQYDYRLLSRQKGPAPLALAARFALPAKSLLIHVEALHLADGRPYTLEDRWINPAAIPSADTAEFSTISPNEWLILNAPFSEGDISLLAESAGPRQAECLDCAEGSALFVLERITRANAQPVTFVTLSYAPGYRMQMAL